MFYTALPWSRKHSTLRLILSFLDQCKLARPHLSGRSPALADGSEEPGPDSGAACTGEVASQHGHALEPGQN